MKRVPPATVLWLLTKSLRGAHSEALVGDLVEQHAHGRSELWLWRQTLVAIAADVAAQLRAAWGPLLLVAFFVGFGAAALLGTVKTLPGFALFDASLAAFAAAWLVSRFGGLAAGLAFGALVVLLAVPPLYATVMAVFDHFGGAWWLTRLGLQALPESVAWTAACIVAGALFGARPGQPTPSRTAQ